MTIEVLKSKIHRAHSKDKFYLILMNASNDEQKLKVHFNKEAITKSRKKLYTCNSNTNIGRAYCPL